MHYFFLDLDDFVLLALEAWDSGRFFSSLDSVGSLVGDGGTTGEATLLGAPDDFSSLVESCSNFASLFSSSLIFS